MRSFFVALIVLLCATAGVAGPVLVQPPMVTLTPLYRVHQACGAEGEFDACTLFVAYRLEARCFAQTITATVTFRPWILLHNMHQLSHEQLHIEDIRTFASAYVTDIEQISFETPSQCEDAATAASAGFGEKMREFARRSNAERHPSRSP